MEEFQRCEDSLVSLIDSSDKTDGTLPILTEHKDIMFKIEELLLLGRSLWDTPDEVITKVLGSPMTGIFRASFIFNIHSIQKIKTMHTLIGFALGIED